MVCRYSAVSITAFNPIASFFMKEKEKTGYFAASGLMAVSAILFWVCDIGLIPAFCMLVAGICFLVAGLTYNKRRM